MVAAILAGGRGTRLRPVLDGRPKVLAPVAGRPFLSYLLDQLLAAGIKKVVLCTGYLAEQVREAFGSSYGDLQILYSQEEQAMDTGGALRLAMPALDSDPALVLNGDSYCDVDMNCFYAWHRENGSLASIALAHSADVTQFGKVTLSADDQILGFDEKRGGGAGWVNAGMYLLSRIFLDRIPPARPVSLEKELFPAWASGGLYGYRSGARLLDIGTPATFEQAGRFLAGCSGHCE